MLNEPNRQQLVSAGGSKARVECYAGNFFTGTKEGGMLDSGLINKIQKARDYADEPERIRFTDLRVEFDGNHSRHDVEYRNGSWRCDCEYFRRHQTCSHIMALDRVLGVMAPAPA